MNIEKNFNFITSKTFFDEFNRQKKSESLFISFLELTPDFIYIKDLNHKFLYTSQSFATLTGFTTWKKLIGKDDFDIFPKRHAQIYFEKEKNVLCKGEHLTNIEEPYYNQEGKLCYVSSSKRPMYDESGRIIGLFGISRDITKRKELENKLEIFASYDSLTQLYNRRFFFIETQKLIEESKKRNLNFVIYFLDLNDFKLINDNHGHEIGDMVLKIVSKRLKNSFRDSDYICRYGGDEFIIMIPEFSSEKEINKISENTKEILSKPIKIFDIYFEIGCSIGTAIFPDDATSIEKLISISDKRMYEDKKRNK